MGTESTTLVKPVLGKPSAGNNHFLKTNFGIHSFLKIPTINLMSHDVSFTARFLDNLQLHSEKVLIVHYKIGNGLIQCFQIIDSIATWIRLGKKKTIKVFGLYSINCVQAETHSETFKLKDIQLTFCQKVNCPRCEYSVKKKNSMVHVCPRCKTKFTTGTK
jgi:ssDNA-binding Zn-finger/Zn-ribbon topoisomerase 1